MVVQIVAVLLLQWYRLYISIQGIPNGKKSPGISWTSGSLEPVNLLTGQRHREPVGRVHKTWS